MESAAYKFANQVLPLMLGDAAQGHAPQSDYSRADMTAPLPQGPTAANSPAIPAPAPVEPHAPAPGVKAASFETLLAQMAGEKLAEELEKEAIIGALGALGRGAVAVGRALPGIARGIGSAAVGTGQAVAGAGKAVAQAAPPIARGAMELGKGVGRAGMAVGRNIPAIAKGYNTASRQIFKGVGGLAEGVGKGMTSIGNSGGALPGVAMAPIAAGAAYAAMPKSVLRSPVTQTGEGVRVRSPIKVLW